jgi:hypothetical protein
MLPEKHTGLTLSDLRRISKILKAVAQSDQEQIRLDGVNAINNYPVLKAKLKGKAKNDSEHTKK